VQIKAFKSSVHACWEIKARTLEIGQTNKSTPTAMGLDVQNLILLLGFADMKLVALPTHAAARALNIIASTLVQAR